MKAIGYLLLIVGFLATTFIASLDPHTVQWAYFIPAAVVALIGVVLIRRSRHLMARADDVLHGNRQTLVDSLERICERLAELNGRKESVPTHLMRQEIDRLFRDDLWRFADARESLTHLYGLQAYADVMSAFAAGERYINRIWSASTDGYQDEVLLYLDRANLQFIQARSKLTQIMGA